MRFIILFCCVLSTMFLNTVFASPLGEQLIAAESSANFQEKTLYTFIQDKDLLATAERVCTNESRQQGIRFGQKLQALLDERYEQMNDAEMLLDSLDLWNRVHAMHGRLPRIIDDEQLCIRKILMYSLQKHLRKWHIELIDERGLIEDFNSPNPQLREVALKKDILDVLIKQAYIKTNKQLPKISVSVVNPDFLDSLSEEQRVLAERSRLVMEAAIYEVLSLFFRKGRFSQHDIDLIKDVIVVEYTENCGSVKGKYEVTYEEDNTGQRKNIQTNAMHLTVSTCTKVGFVLQSFWLSKLIVIHELGHHVRWHIDADPKRYASICRGEKGFSNGNCKRRDFVSDYAFDDDSIPQESQPAEDYAEHFQQWVIKRRSRPGFIDTKLRYFDRLFSQ